MESGEATMPTTEAFISEFREALRQDILNDNHYQPGKYFYNLGSEAYPFIGDTCIHAVS